MSLPGDEEEPVTDPWYADRVGRSIVLGFVAATLLVVGLSLDWNPGDGPGAVASVVTNPTPLEVYVYGVMGAMTRALLVFVADVGPEPEPEPEPGSSLDPLGRPWEALLGQGVRLFAALCLSVGVYQLSGVVEEGTIVTDSPVALVAGTAFVVGFYVDRTYQALGVVADRILAPFEDEEGAGDGGDGSDGDGADGEGGDSEDRDGAEPAPVGGPSDLGRGGTNGPGPSEPARRRQSLAASILLRERPRERPAAATEATGGEEGDTGGEGESGGWAVDWRGRVLFALGLVVTVLVVAVTAVPGLVPFVQPIETRVPADTYVYGFLGAMGYVFTTLFDQFDRDVPSLVGIAMRIPAAVLLAAGLHLFTFVFVGGDADAVLRLRSGLAFLVGLYVNVALVALDSVSNTLFSRLTGSTD